MDIVGYAKSHPWTTGAIVVGGGLVFLVIAGGLGGGSNPGNTDSGPSDAEIAASAQIAAAQIQAQAAASQAGAALQAANIGAGVQMNSDRLQSEVAMRELEVNQTLGLAGTEANRQVGLAQIGAQRDVSIATIAGQTETQRIIAGASNTASNNSRRSSTLSSIASVATAAFAFFSDERLKENVVRVGVHPNGYTIYEYNYVGDTKRRQGVIAQEVRQYRPDLVLEDKSGYLKVKPQALAA